MIREGVITNRDEFTAKEIAEAVDMLRADQARDSFYRQRDFSLAASAAIRARNY